MSDAATTGPGLQQKGASKGRVAQRPLRFFILGATGRSGSRLVASALQQGHLVSAVVRNEARVAREWRNLKSLEIIVGDVADAATIECSWAGQAPDALFCMLSSEQKPHDAVSTGTRAVIDALAAEREASADQGRTRPFISIASWGLGPTEPFITGWGPRAIVGFAKRTFWAGPYWDFQKQFELLFAARQKGLLRPTFIAPPILTDAACETAYLSGDTQAMRQMMRLSSTVARMCIADLAIKLAERAVGGEETPEWVAIRDLPKRGGAQAVPAHLLTEMAGAVQS